VAIVLEEKSDDAFKKYIENNWPRIEEDFEDSINFVNKFFDDNIISNIYNWNECVNIERKGAAIFKEQQNRNKILSSLHSLSSKEILINKELIEKRSILIFDDSIKNGKTIRDILNSIFKYKPTNITVATLIARNDALEKLRDELKEDIKN